MKEFLQATLLLLFLKKWRCSHHCTAAEFVEITRTRAAHLPCQPTRAAKLLLKGDTAVSFFRE
jgi:hypothetical protein